MIHEAIIASWMRIGKPYKKEERTNQYEKKSIFDRYTPAIASISMNYPGSEDKETEDDA